MYHLVAQAVGLLGMALCISCFQCKSSALLILLQLAGNTAFIIHFVMLGALSGCLSIAVTVASSMVMLLCIRGKRWAMWKGWKWVFSLLIAVACALTWQNAFSLLPCAASIGLILTNWSGNTRVIRLGKLFFVGPGWLVYNVYVHSVSAVISESFGMCSALISLYRHRGKNAEEPAPLMEKEPAAVAEAEQSD